MYITVKDLIELLQKEQPERVVICQSDSEGNGFSPLALAYTGAYRQNEPWSGEIIIEELTPELRQQGFTEEDMRGGIPALVLQPTN